MHALIGCYDTFPWMCFDIMVSMEVHLCGMEAHLCGMEAHLCGMEARHILDIHVMQYPVIAHDLNFTLGL